MKKPLCNFLHGALTVYRVREEKINLLNTKYRTEPQHNEQILEDPNYSDQS